MLKIIIYCLICQNRLETSTLFFFKSVAKMHTLSAQLCTLLFCLFYSVS